MSNTFVKFGVLVSGWLVFSSLTNTIQAEESDTLILKSRKGEIILPEKGDWAIGMDAVPVLNYLGGFLSNSGATAPSVNFINAYPMTISGKYFTSNQQAIRARVRIGLVSSSVKNSVVDMVNTNIDTVYSQDVRRHNSTNIMLAGGKEYRKGKSRLQGFYGYEFFMNISRENIRYDYANQFSNTNPSVLSSDFNSPNELGYNTSLTSSRIKEDRSGTGFGLGARGFIGAEFFILPKLSIGAEFGWSVSYFNQNDGRNTIEIWDNVGGTVRQRSLVKAGVNRFGVDTDNTGGAMMITFHF
jgi:hypothetical protein